MANNELPKAQLGAIINGIKVGASAGKLAFSKAYKVAKNIKAIEIAKKRKAIIDAAAKAARTQKAAATRAANAKAANAAKNPKPGTPKPGTPKGKKPFVKSKARSAVENVVGKGFGYATFGTANAIKAGLKKPMVRGLIGTSAPIYIYDRYKKTNAPKKVKKIKKK